MDNQERNREALIEHIAEQDRIIRRRNEQIANQAHNARESQRAIEELDARNNSLAADLAAAVVRAEKAEQERDEWKESAIKAMADLERAEQPRPLTADDITDEMERRLIRKGIEFGWFAESDINDRDTRDRVRALLGGALTEPPRPEWADLADVLGDFAVADEHTGDRDDMVLARRLHERGVRVTGGN